MTAATADAIEPHVRAGRGELRLGVPETAKAPVAAAFAARQQSPTLLLVSTPARAQAFAEELALFLEDVPLARLPEREGLPYEFARDDIAVSLERARALTLLRGPGRALVVASWAALSEHCAPPGLLAEAIEIRTGDSIEPQTLAARLEAAGYLVEPLADRPGTLSRHGGLADIFPVGAEAPVRVEFFGNDVESIRLVEFATQRSVRRLDAISLPPAATGTRQARDAARALLDGIRTDGERAEAVTEQLEL
ncbi:MAG: hypothetical protein ACRDG3_01280, partial [Tepidiformaceae bacterium]